DWRAFLFPDADDNQFADAYAQTVTYALLLARFSGSTDLGTEAAARTIARGHALLAQTLRILTDEQARREIEIGIDLLERAIGAVDTEVLKEHHADPWLYFYEDFLAAYDPRLRKDRGVYYTPVQVVGTQVRLVAELLERRLGKPLTYADDGVVLLDPAVGTGTYPLAAMAEALERVRARYGEGAVAGRASTLARNTHGFELLIGAYAVAHLRLSQQVLGAGGELPADGAHVYLTDTLESPHAEPHGQMTLLYKPLSEEHRRAQRVKAETRVLVCIGNPPYDRQQIEAGDLATLRKGGWVRYGDHDEGGILEDFMAPTRRAGAGVHLKNLYNDYVYFWRWALWKVFESTGGAGVVSFISASSYLRGPGFVGMREVMRRTFDELWIIDLEGDNLGARKTENVFAIQTPVAIAVGVRYGHPRPESPAPVRYVRVQGTRDEKLAALDGIRGFAGVGWQDCPDEWGVPFLPRGAGDYFSWPLLTDLFPWQHSGVQMKRTWPIASTAETLERRWHALLAMSTAETADAFGQTRDRTIYRPNRALQGDRPVLPPLATVRPGTSGPAPVPYAYRSFDRQQVLPDTRIGDFMRPVLWSSWTPRQLYLTSFLSGVLGLGPAATVTHLIPDMDYFRGSFGAKHIIPLWRDADATQPNVTDGLLVRITQALGLDVSAEDFMAYCYAVLGTPSYVERFSEELTIPGPRMPITRDRKLFGRVVDLGRRLIWLHTYGERFVPSGQTAGALPQGSARNIVAVPGTTVGYPEHFSYDALTQTLHVGEGTFAPVSQDVWSFSVSAFHVVRAWLAYRMKSGAGRMSSPLDLIRPERWTPQLTEELLELLWVLEATVELYPELAAVLDSIVASETLKASELPSPSADQRRPPSTAADEDGPLQAALDLA
ncbi:MAG: N-6 DNA methylase, partial [Chloroflexi bacterium]|nr:N-6 DNA methylase [Chloroflexota bacterium]